MAKKAHSNGHSNNKSQGFSFRAPEAISVQLVGDFTQWQEHPISLKKENGGVWHASVELAPGTHHYRFLVDGEWRDDPDCLLRVPNGFGSQNMARKVN
jgi:1,4-alpha-glucan branching enzyme